MPNPIGLYSRIKTWGPTDTILAADLNAEFDNVLNNFNPEMLAGYSQNAAQMQTQTYPGAIGSESLATSIAGELERLRYQINVIMGTTYWYQAPPTSLISLNSLVSAAALGNRIVSGLTSGTTGSAMPAFLVAAGGSSQVVTLKASTTSFNYQIAGSNYVVSSDTTVSGLTLAPSTQNTATVSDLTLPQAGTASAMLIGENGSQITVASAGTGITNLKGSYAAFKTTAGEYLLGYVESNTQITQCLRGYFYNSSSVAVTRGTISNGDTLTLMKLTWVFISTTGTLNVVYTNPKAGGQAPTSPAVNDYWYDTSVNLWKQYTGTVWSTANAILIGVCLQDTSGCIATRSFDFFNTYSDLNNLELFADSQNSGTIVRSRHLDAQVSVYGSLITIAKSETVWDFSISLDTGAQAASTQYYFYLDTNGRSWISVTAPHDRRNDLRGYYHPNKPWRCFGWGWSNAGTLLDNVESFYRSDDCTPVSNITAANNNIILPYNIVQREQVVTLTGAAGAFTQVLPPPAQLRGKFITYVRTDSTMANVITLQSWGTQAGNFAGTISTSSNPTVMTGLGASTASISPGQLITGQGIVPNTTVSSVGSGVATMSASAILTSTSGTYNFANAAGFGGTVGQQTGYVAYGVNGRFTVTLNTQYESYTLTSDGFAYYIVQHYAQTPWVRSGTISFNTGTKGSVINDDFFWRRSGSNVEIRLQLITTTAGSAGSGTYQMSGLPSGISFDNTVYTNGNTPAAIFTSSGYYTASAARSASVVAQTTTSVSLFGTNVGTYFGSADQPLSGGSGVIVYCGASIPASGWFA